MTVPPPAPPPPPEDRWLLPAPLRPLAIVTGLLLSGLGVLGTVLPGMPGTVFLIGAAWLFSRSSPRFERWLLDLPLVGPLVDDYRRGLGMPRRAKWIAYLSIAIAVSFSLGRIPVLVGQVGWVLLGLAGIWYIAARVPTKA